LAIFDCRLSGDPRFWAKNEGKTVDYECDGVGNRRFWAKNGGASIDYLRFSIADWVETLVFRSKTGVQI